MRALPLVVLLVSLAACSRSEQPRATPPSATFVAGRFDTGGSPVSLPREVGGWSRPETPRRIASDTIFDYMDGAGELYLAYRFDHLDVFEYTAADASRGTILVELYSMKTSDDAFGLLSNDWGGEAAPIAGITSPGWPDAVPQRATLYGGGLLRIASGNRYVRVLAARETPESREAVLTIGREIVTRAGPEPLRADAKGVPPPAPTARRAEPGSAMMISPPLLTRGSCKASEGLTIRPDRTCFFRSHLVLNSQYFLASEDILGLGLDVDAVTFEYGAAAPANRPTRVILIRYPSAERARAGLSRFMSVYLESDRKHTIVEAGSAQTEHGWVAWARKTQDLAIVLDAASAAAASNLAACTLAAAPAPGSGFAD